MGARVDLRGPILSVMTKCRPDLDRPSSPFRSDFGQLLPTCRPSQRKSGRNPATRDFGTL
eukprot:7470556-Pyramimonas_sp.AAC.1